jgi:hypothetical protein
MANQQMNDNRPQQPQQQAGERQMDQKGGKAAKSTGKKPSGHTQQQRRDSRH